MKASTERKVMRWIHLIISIPVIGYIYGPVAQMPESARAVKVVFFPILVLSGLWMWKGQSLKKWLSGSFTKPRINSDIKSSGD
jgi:thiosulfate reductase cytochrome b subunit